MDELKDMVEMYRTMAFMGAGIGGAALMTIGMNNAIASGSAGYEATQALAKPSSASPARMLAKADQDLGSLLANPATGNALQKSLQDAQDQVLVVQGMSHTDPTLVTFATTKADAAFRNAADTYHGQVSDGWTAFGLGAALLGVTAWRLVAWYRREQRPMHIVVTQDLGEAMLLSQQYNREPLF